MRILLSAFDCDPFAGSESGVGWNWAINLGREHDVTVITRRVNRQSIERYEAPLPDGLRFEYFDNGDLVKKLARLPYRQHLYFGAWQRQILPLAQKLHEKQAFDVAHHITWGAWRQPSHLHRLGIPLIFGPVGGGDTTPHELVKTLDLRRRSIEQIRFLANHGFRCLPSLQECLRQSKLIVCRTEGTRSWIPRKYWPKTLIHWEIGIDSERIACDLALPREDHKLRILYVGRFIGLKGIHLGLKAFARFIRRYPGCGEFHLVGGRGTSKEKLLKLVSAEDLVPEIHFHEWLPRAEILKLYRNFDLFLFPSFRDSSGNVVLESLAAGLPVICLDLGGPPELLGGKGGLVVPAQNRSENEVIGGLQDALERMYLSPELLNELRTQALARANELTWDKTIHSLYSHVERAVLQ